MILKKGTQQRQRAFDLNFPFIASYNKYYCSLHKKYFNLFHPCILESLPNNVITIMNGIPTKIICFAKTILVNYVLH